MWCAMTHWCLPTILWVLRCSYLQRLLHRMWHSQIGCLHHILSVYFSTNNQLLCGPLFHSCGIIHRNGVLFCSWFFLPCFCLPTNQILCDHIFQIYCTWPCRTCSCFAFFLRSLFLEIYLQDLAFLVSSFCINLFSITNKFLSWDPCILFSKCLHCKILS